MSSKEILDKQHKCKKPFLCSCDIDELAEKTSDSMIEVVKNHFEQRIESGQHGPIVICKEEFEAWKEGSAARLKGLELHICPYKSRTRKADAWENGWEVTDCNLDCT